MFIIVIKLREINHTIYLIIQSTFLVILLQINNINFLIH